jgi:hypothetical protein
MRTQALQHTLYQCRIFTARHRRLRMVTIIRHACLQIRGGEHASIKQAFEARMQPLFVVAGGQVVDRVHLLNIMPEAARNGHRSGSRYGKYSPLPGLVEDGFVLFPHHGTEPVHAPHIMNAIH